MTTRVIAFDIGVRNLGVAASSIEACGDATLEWLDTADVSASCGDRCIAKLWTYLDALLARLGWAGSRYCVAIERQPSKACSLMRTIELGVRHYFLMRAHRGTDVVAVRSVSPRRKLSAPVVYAPGSSKAQQYRARKNAAVTEAVRAFAALPDAVKVLQSGKGDDAADASLYLVSFYNARNFVRLADGALANAHARADDKAAVSQAGKAAKAAVSQARKAEKAAVAQALRAEKAAVAQALRAEKAAAAQALKAEKAAAASARKADKAATARALKADKESAQVTEYVDINADADAATAGTAKPADAADDAGTTAAAEAAGTTNAVDAAAAGTDDCDR